MKDRFSPEMKSEQKWRKTYNVQSLHSLTDIGANYHQLIQLLETRQIELLQHIQQDQACVGRAIATIKVTLE